jgi:hypothetical protein
MKKRARQKPERIDDASAESNRRPDPGGAGQAGDLQGLSDVAEADSESVKELLEEGQSLDAAAISGVENAPDPDVAEVTTRQVPEDDVPLEYQGDFGEGCK